MITTGRGAEEEIMISKMTRGRVVTVAEIEKVSEAEVKKARKTDLLASHESPTLVRSLSTDTVTAAMTTISDVNMISIQNTDIADQERAQELAREHAHALLASTPAENQVEIGPVLFQTAMLP